METLSPRQDFLEYQMPAAALQAAAFICRAAASDTPSKPGSFSL